MSEDSTSLGARSGGHEARDEHELLRDVLQEGDGDATRGTEKAVAKLLAAMVSRQQTLDAVAAAMRSKRDLARITHDRTIAAIRQERTERLSRSQTRSQETITDATTTRESALAGIAEARSAKRRELKAAHQAEHDRLKKSMEEAILLADALREAGDEADRNRTRDLGERLRLAEESAAAQVERGCDYLANCGLKRPVIRVELPQEPSTPGEIEIAALLTSLEQHVDALQVSKSTRFLSGFAPYILSAGFVIFAAVAGGASTLFDPARWLPATGYAAAGAFIVSILGVVLLRRSASGAIRRMWTPLEVDLASLARARVRAEAEDQAARLASAARLDATQKADERAARARYEPRLAEVPKTLERKLAEVEQAVEIKRAEVIQEADRAISEAQTQAVNEEREILASAAAAEQQEFARVERERIAFAEEEESRLTEARHSWMQTASSCRDRLLAVARVDQTCTKPWSELQGNHAITCTRAPWFRFGQCTLTPNLQPGGLPTDPAFFVEMPEQMIIPAALGFPSRGNLALTAPAAARTHAMQACRALIARLLVTIPPSKLRCTFIDPVGLGENFASFMHLADEYELLVGERIWTDPRSIEQKLTDLCEHMETVIQKYLRNEFADIDAYNRAAGEIAEPYRFVICADFPTNFSEQAAARFLSILRAGQRCGVHVILIRDPSAPLPDGITAADLAESCIEVRCDAKGIASFATGAFATLPLELDAPPSDSALMEMMAVIGRAAKSAARVEVPFDAIAPKENAFWSLSSAKNLRVPVGRAGATRLQQFLLGEGTSQHALIAGKTGSGKSTLLHAIITGIATWYSPDEVELWLVDFKKGVEFKTYAEHALPHARAGAIESDREFGLSVLEGLDAELSRRGELFRDAGVQDIASFRAARPETRMPRILLVIDEFQEFFLDDDRVSQGASMLLDRLVRQGRAFGMHALLGSQTLGGAYSLARSTMGQMGVRIALQCSEADSQLILSDENLAARLLSRPGEAIYNDAGGRIEGNSPFQVAYLPDERRDDWLDRVESNAKGRFDKLPRIVFEGDARAPMSLHPGIKRHLASDPRGNVRVWVGEAVAIKDPTCARLARAAGANVAAISPRDDQSVATAAAMLASIAAETPGAIIDVFDGVPADAPEHGALERFARDRGITANFVAYREVEAKLAEIAADVVERADESGRSRRFILVHHLQRYRMLRRNEDDFSFGASDAPPSADKLLAGIVRDGPVTGVHTLVVCDTLASLQRAFDRAAMREFDWKVLFQISPADSSSLIDSPAASRLGTNRGILHSEELGILEKFRPYGF